MKGWVLSYHELICVKYTVKKLLTRVAQDVIRLTTSKIRSQPVLLLAKNAKNARRTDKVKKRMPSDVLLASRRKKSGQKRYRSAAQ